MKTTEEYKRLSISEFTKAAKRYDSGNAGIYEMCKEDYPPILEEIRGEKFDTLLDAGCGTAPMLSLLIHKAFIITLIHRIFLTLYIGF